MTSYIACRAFQHMLNIKGLKLFADIVQLSNSFCN